MSFQAAWPCKEGASSGNGALCGMRCAGLVPGLICLVSVPLILYVIYPPEVKDTPDAPTKARCQQRHR